MSDIPNHKHHLVGAAQALYVDQETIKAAHPLHGNPDNHSAWDAALLLVGERHAKHDLVDLVGYMIAAGHGVRADGEQLGRLLFRPAAPASLTEAWNAKNGKEDWGHEPTAKRLFEDGWAACLAASSTAPTTGSAPEAWHDAVLNACMVRESCYIESDPAKTVQQLLSWEAESALAQASPAASVPFLSESDMAALFVFHSQVSDHEADGYTARKETMKRLAELGVVNSLGFGRYETTAFGAWLVETDFEQNPTLPLRSVAEHNARSALRAASMGGDKS